MATRTVGIILNGATSRIGSTQHLKNALTAIRAEGGLVVGADQIMPRVLLVGRDADRLASLAREHGVESETDLDAALADPAYEVLFDAAVTHQRQATLVKAMKARGLKHAAVEDKQYLPGLCKLAALAKADFFGRVVGFRLEFGWWVFDGIEERCQRPSWNYRKAGGGLILDMYSHFRYMIENILGPIERVACAATTAVPERIDEHDERYRVDVEDHSAALVTLKSGAVGTILASWATRVRRDDLMAFQIDGTRGSAIAGLHRCFAQAIGDTPKVAAFNVMTDLGIDYASRWQEVPSGGPYPNPYRVGWEDFLRHLVAGTPLRSDFTAGIRDVAFAEACYRSLASGASVRLDDVLSE